MGSDVPLVDPFIAVFLARLRHLLELERSLGSGDGDRPVRLLVYKATFSTWLDCQALGLAAEAARLLQHAHRPTGRTV